MKAGRWPTPRSQASANDSTTNTGATPGLSPRLLAIPAMQSAERDEFTVALVELFGKLLEEQTHAPGRLSRGSGSRLAVPLIGLDQVVAGPEQLDEVLTILLANPRAARAACRRTCRFSWTGTCSGR